MRSLPMSAAELQGEGAAPRGVAPRIAREIAVAFVAVAVIVVVTGLAAVLDAVSMDRAGLLLGVTACAFAAMAAILAALAGRLMEDHRLGWLSATLTFYSLVDVPATTSGWGVAPIDPVVDAGRMAAWAVVVGLLYAAVRPPRKPWPGSRWIGGMLGVLLTLGTAWVAQLNPEAAAAVTTFLPMRLLLSACGIGVGVWLAVLGWRRNIALARVGIGFTVMALAQLDRLAADSGWFDQSGLTFATLRVLGVVFVLLGMAQLTYGVLRAVDERQSQHQEQLRLAQLSLDQVAERDHELRNGLAGLAGATDALVAVPGGDRDALRSAVASELARLGALLGGSARDTTDMEIYPLRPVLRDVVLLWRTTGMQIRLDADPGLRAHGVPDTLAQVVTNVVANCARHAPGSPVRVQALRCGDRVRIRISDLGPGLGTNSENRVFDRRVRDKASEGQGLGLYICRKLLAQDGGSIRMLPAQVGRPGCTVVIELHSAAALISHRTAQQAVSSPA